MAFDAFETSIEGSKPIELYRFIQGGSTFEYTSAEDEQTVDAIDYPPESISRGKIGQSREDKDNVLEIELPASNVFVQQFTNVVPGNRVEFILSRVQRDDFPSPEVVTLFTGFVQSVSFDNNATVARVAVLPIQSAASRPVPRHTYMALCNHVIYDDRCQVDDTDLAFRHTGEVLSITGSVIEVANANTFPDGFFSGGYAEGAGGVDPRLVRNHTGNNLTLLLPFAGSVLGTTLVVLAGCDHTIGTCDSKFFTAEDTDSNVLNFGGFFYVPTKNIFTVGVD